MSLIEIRCLTLTRGWENDSNQTGKVVSCEYVARRKTPPLANFLSFADIFYTAL